MSANDYKFSHFTALILCGDILPEIRIFFYHVQNFRQKLNTNESKLKQPKFYCLR